MEPEFIRNEWVRRSRFAPADESGDRGVLTQVLARVRAGVGSGVAPVVVVDLDSTLYEVAPRTLKIIRDWRDGAGDEAGALAEAIGRVQMEHVGYSLRDTLAQVGFDTRQLAPSDHSAFESLKNYWSRRFFSNADMHHDRPYPGAAEWVMDLYASGATIVYLTGRDRPNMLEGTIANLRRDGFPLEETAALHPERTHLYLKTHPSVPDVEHKVGAVREVSKLGRVVAQFENEPKNFVALARAFPEAMHVFMHTVSSDHPAETVAHPEHAVYRICSFPRQ